MVAIPSCGHPYHRPHTRTPPTKVTLIDAIPDPTGATPYLSASGKPVEAGTRGFWKDYPNIESMAAELGLDENQVWTKYTNSSFYSPDGLEATAPVFGTAKLPVLESPVTIPAGLPNPFELLSEVCNIMNLKSRSEWQPV